jgi:drug/metabolite transporter (DMT)-like permease
MCWPDSARTTCPGCVHKAALRARAARNVYPLRVTSWSWLFLGALICAYGVANLLQSVAAARTDLHQGFHPRLLLRLGRHKSYIIGVVCQFSGFLLAFLARRDLPLFLVQSAVAAGLGVTTILGMLILKWQLPRAEIILLLLLCLGIAALVIAAKPSPSRQLGPAGVIGLLVALAGIAVAGFFAARLHGPRGSVALGSLAGVAFGAAAVASRPLASAGSAGAFVSDPLLYLLLAHTVVGQLLLGLAMQRGSTTAAVAAMDAAAAVPAAIIGLLFLGDEVHPGRGWLVAFGFVFALGGVIGLSYYAEPQHHHKVSEAVNGRHRPGLLDGAQLGTSTMPKAPFASSASNSSAGTARAKWKP